MQERFVEAPTWDSTLQACFPAFVNQVTELAGARHADGDRRAARETRRGTKRCTTRGSRRQGTAALPWLFSH